VSVWGEIFLGVIAVATLVMAIGQVIVAVVCGRVARRLSQIADTLDKELKPLFVQVHAIARDASRAAALATAQVERADRLFADLIARFESIAGLVQESIAGPVKQGSAVLFALRTAFNIVRGVRAGRRQGRPDDEDALFI
jgi:hypothetical protein